MHDLAIRDARILKGNEWLTCDLGVDEGKFSSLAAGPARLEVDAKQAMVLPGGVDLHVHFNEPGRTHWEGFASGSLSAAAGGNTFLVEMPLNSIPSTVSREHLQTKLEAIGTQSLLDFALWGGLVPGNVDEILGLHEGGVAGFKAFMSPSGTNDFENSDTQTLEQGMREIAKTGKLLAIHAEDPAVLSKTEAALQSRESAIDWELSRPKEAELSAVKIAIDLAGSTGCKIHIVHVSSPEVLELINEAKNNGLEISCETCPHYLLLSLEQAAKIGPHAKCAPPLRPEETVSQMWTSLRDGLIDTIGSDHSPAPPDLKSGKSVYDAWGGISGVQHGLPLLWQQGLKDLALFQRLVELSTVNPAKLIHLPNKGVIEVGYDADFTIVEELANPRGIALTDLHYRHPTTAFEGFPLALSVKETWQGGRCVYRDGKASGEPQGQFVKR